MLTSATCLVTNFAIYFSEMVKTGIMGETKKAGAGLQFQVNTERPFKVVTRFHGRTHWLSL